MNIIWVQITSLIYIILLILFYFSKKRLLTLENRIFKYLILSNAIGLIIEIGCFYTVSHMDTMPVTNMIVTRLLLVYYIVFLMIYTYYIYIISKNYLSEVKMTYQLKKVKKLFIIFCLINSLFVCFLKMDYYYDGISVYSYGPAVKYLRGLLIFLFVLWVVVLIKNFKNIKAKKYVPVIMFIVLGLIGGIVQVKYPELLLTTPIETFILFMMYFTIENPDLQLLREFHNQQEKLENSNNEKANFLFNTSSSLKSPMESIQNIVKESENLNDIDLLKENLNNIKNLSNELLSIINNVLDISELETRKISIKGSEYNAYNLFNTINKLYACEDKHFEYRFSYDNNIPPILYGDPIRLKQIMSILIENAKKYTKEGFIEVNVNHVIKYDICRLIITVEDSGIGMDQDTINHLFDKNKIYSDEKRKIIDDTKNNLGILKSLVNLMNGTVMVNSEVGKGSKFTIVLDQKIPKQEKTKTKKLVEKYEELYGKNEILVVVNDLEIDKKINKFLKKTKYSVNTVTSGQECLEKIRNNENYELIIIEDKLEKLSSEDTLIKLKEINNDIKVVVITKEKQVGIKDEAIKKGFDDIILLPIKKEELIKIVEKYIEK